MRSKIWKWFQIGLLASPFATAIACRTYRTDDMASVEDGPLDCRTDTSCPDHARVCKNPTVQALACDLDHLEKHIDWYGSVTAKVPDVWGQARLTQHREEFERELAKDLTTFEAGLQGSFARNDQSYLAAAMSLGIASQPKSPVIGSVTTGNKTVTPPVLAPSEITTTTTTSTADKDKAGTTTETVKKETPVASPASPPQPTPIPIPTTPDPETLVSKANDVIKRSDKVEFTKITFKGQSDGIGIEPTERLLQKKRYLDLLNQLRRENEGSDTADAPGYQLNLVRIPVNVLPGHRTDRGFGAEVTFTIDPVLGHDLLPTTFRRMVTNDVAQQLGLPLTSALEIPAYQELMTNEFHDFVIVATRIADYLEWGSKECKATQYINSLSDSQKSRFLQYAAKYEGMVEAFKKLEKGDSPSRAPFELKKFQTENLSGRFSNVAAPALSFSNGLDNKISFPTSQLFDAYGEQFIYEIGFGAHQALSGSIEFQGYVHLPDIQAYLKEELRAAYEFLAKNSDLLEEFCTLELVSAIRSRNITKMTSIRRSYRLKVACKTGSEVSHHLDRESFHVPQIQLTKTAALAWCLIVDSALLTDRLLRDMRESATSKGKSPPSTADAWPQFFLPGPPQHARDAFRDYVKLRWPIYVFALDPMVQEQNIADSLSTRRETQLALAIGFTNGEISARTFLNAARRLETEAQTIALNRTQIGFAHGENTFGWRFYPRFQTMPTQTNPVILIRDQIIGGPTQNAILRQRRLEPGPRECVALVIMPSFVPYVNLDVVSNWFRLPDPKCKVLDHTQAMKLSKTIKTLENCEHNVTDADCYRDGELKRLQTRVHQLANRLPTQSMTVPVPVVNTLGGFEMFSNGTTDLAPELYGWYGAEGVSTDRDTTLFLVGDHFSPLRTHVIVGNSEVGKDANAPALKMLSRQVMQITVRKGAVTAIVDENTGYKYAQTHVATPYGVSRELYIPVVSDVPAVRAKKVEGYELAPMTLKGTYSKVLTADGSKFMIDSIKFPDDGKLTVSWADELGTAPFSVTLAMTFSSGNVTHTTKGLPGSGKKYVADKVFLDALAKDLVDRYATTMPITIPLPIPIPIPVLIPVKLSLPGTPIKFTAATDPFAKPLIAKVKVVPFDVYRRTFPVDLTGEFTVELTPEISK